MGEEQWASIRGCRMAYELTGRGPDLVWGHGLTESRAAEAERGLLAWDRIPARVLRYDARGHGVSDSTPDLSGYGWDELARDQLALATHCGIGSYFTGGASMGCGTALHAARVAPDRIRGLLLVIPPTAWETRAAQADMWEASAALLERDGVEAMIAALAERPAPNPYAGDPTYLDMRARHLRAWNPGRLAHVLRGATRADFPSRADLASIDAPALILAWTGDPVHPLSTAEELADLLPRAHLHVAASAVDLAGWTGQAAEFVRRLS